MNHHRTRAALAAMIVIVLAAGCSTLPTSGDVITEPGPTAGSGAQAPYFAPPGPVPGADPETIVRGFLLAAQANPPSTSVARSFLSEAARSTWKPSGATVYGTSTLESVPGSVVAHLTDANRIDQRGSWVAADRPPSVDLRLDLVQENGEWRIQNPPTSLPVPASYFRNTYLPFLLYFLDRSGTVLVPSRVYLPRGEQIASSLVRGLLAGPPSALAAATTRPAAGLDLDLSVVIDEDGVAEVPLSTAVQQLSRGDLYRLAVQLSQTLRQVSGLVRFRVTVGGVAIPLVNGQTDVGVDLAPAFDPVLTPDEPLAAIVGGRVVLEDGDGTRPIGGPLGEEGFALRSLAVSAAQDEVAAVARNGRRAYLAPTNGDRSTKRVRTALDGARNLLRPCFDRFGNLWLVDAAPGGAVVHVVTDGDDRVLEVPGISGEQVSAFTVTRDGATLVAARAGAAPALLVSSLVRYAGGPLARAEQARRVLVVDPDPSPILDLAQDSATGVVVLTGTSPQSGELRSVELDGSPGQAFAVSPPALPARGTGVLARPDGLRGTRVVTVDGQLLGLSRPQGEWVASLAGVLDAAYPQ